MAADVELLSIGDNDTGARLDSFLASKLQDISRTRIQRGIEDGDVLVNERPSKASYRVRSGDRIEVDLPEPPRLELTREPIPLSIIFEDDDLIVVDKPAGMVVHPGAGVDSGTLANALAYHFNNLSETGGRIRPGIVHRIDKETSGLLVVAKNDVVHERLSDQFRTREVLKLYLALVYGRVSQSTGEVSARIGRSPHNRTRMAVLRGGAGREAVTLYRVEELFSEFTLLQVRIKTGRTHQIRVHMAHVGHPVVGDETYGSGRINLVRVPSVKSAIRTMNRHFLHSAHLAFRHPRSGERLQFDSHLPEELRQLLTSLSH